MFEAMLSDLRDRDPQFTVYRSGEQLDIEAWLANHGITVTATSLPPGGPDPFIEITTDDEVVGGIGVESLEALLEPPIRWPGNDDGVSRNYRVLFDALERAVFSGMTRRELLAVSREIEDRAYRVGTGTLRVGFQTLSTFKSQADLYRTLAAETQLEIHIHGLGDWEPPHISGITYHTDQANHSERYWVLAFDGGHTDNQASGLVAKEEPNAYTGFWTNDSALVTDIAARLSQLE